MFFKKTLKQDFIIYFFKKILDIEKYIIIIFLYFLVC
jgi:hypothetical protein